MFEAEFQLGGPLMPQKGVRLDAPLSSLVIDQSRRPHVSKRIMESLAAGNRGSNLLPIFRDWYIKDPLNVQLTTAWLAAVFSVRQTLRNLELREDKGAHRMHVYTCCLHWRLAKQSHDRL